MQTISVNRAGFALGTTFALLYFGCVFLMLTASHDVVVQFFNNILHGWDVASIMRWDMPWWEAIIGIVEIFILGWMVGATYAVFYNLSFQRRG